MLGMSTLKESWFFIRSGERNIIANKAHVSEPPHAPPQCCSLVREPRLFIMAVYFFAAISSHQHRLNAHGDLFLGDAQSLLSPCYPSDSPFALPSEACIPALRAPLFPASFSAFQASPSRTTDHLPPKSPSPITTHDLQHVHPLR